MGGNRALRKWAKKISLTFYLMEIIGICQHCIMVTERSNRRGVTGVSETLNRIKVWPKTECCI